MNRMRDDAAVVAVLSTIRDAANGRNLMPVLIEAGRAHVTEGEIVHALQDVWGGYSELPAF